MRHFFRRRRPVSPQQVSRLAGRVPVAAGPAGLIPPPCRLDSRATTLPRAVQAAVPLAAVTKRADRYQGTTANAGKEPIVLPHRQPPAAEKVDAVEDSGDTRSQNTVATPCFEEKAQGDRQSLVPGPSLSLQRPPCRGKPGRCHSAPPLRRAQRDRTRRPPPAPRRG